MLGAVQEGLSVYWELSWEPVLTQTGELQGKELGHSDVLHSY